MNIKTIIFLLALSITITTSFAQTRKTVTTKKGVTNSTTAIEAREKALFEEMLPNTQRLFVIDSTIVNKDDVLSAIPLPKDYGTFVPYNSIFPNAAPQSTFVFVNGFGNKCYYSLNDSTGHSRFFTIDKEGLSWGKPKEVTTLGEDLAYISHPYMSADGSTLYFAAKSKEGLGGYDLYVTSFDTDEATFRQAENMGLPFNSADDDLLYVTDDTDSLAWLATTRRQPEGSICVYTIATSPTRQNYDINEYATTKIKNLASIVRIRDTWPTPELRERAMTRLANLKRRNAQNTGNETFRFVVNENIVYENLDEFKSPADRQAYISLKEKKAIMEEKTTALVLLREKYHNTPKTSRKKMADNIIRAEQDLNTLQEEIQQAEKSLRNNEILLNKH